MRREHGGPCRQNSLVEMKTRGIPGMAGYLGGVAGSIEYSEVEFEDP